MTVHRFLTFVTLPLVFSYQTIGAIEVYEGRLQDVVVAASGTSDSTFVTELADGWLARGPNVFDVDKHGNVYILDWLGEKVVKFDKNGKWLRSIKVPRDSILGGTRYLSRVESHPGLIRSRSDLVVDNGGNIYLTLRNDNLLKLSPDGATVFRLDSPSLPYVAVDKDGGFYHFGDVNRTVYMYTSQRRQQARMVHDFEYPDRLIVQKETGNDLYFRVGKYLTRTNLEDYLTTGKLDTVAILPNKLRLTRYEDEGVEHELPLPAPFILLGYDKEERFYFHRPEHWWRAARGSQFCETHLISIWRLLNGESDIVGTVEICFLKGEDGECSDKGLWDFTKRKRFIVSGDGTIYFLHGTVDTVKVSKVIMD